MATPSIRRIGRCLALALQPLVSLLVLLGLALLLGCLVAPLTALLPGA